MKKRILHILASNKFSGAENVVCSIIENTSDEFEMAYCSPRGPIEKILKDKNIKYFGINKLNHKNLKKIIKEYQPDIVHAHDFKATLVATRFNKKYKIISHLHNNDPRMKKPTPRSLLYMLILKKITKIVGVSDSVIKEYIYGEKIKSKYVTISNFTDESKIIQKSNEFKINKKYDIFFFARLHDQKDPLRFIDIINKIGDKNLSCVMIGDGPLSKECEAKIKNLGLEKNIELVGFQDNPLPYVKNSQIGILPSKYEGFGITVIESLILKKPVFNSGVGGLAEIFKNHKYFICQTNDDYVKKIKNYQKPPENVFKKAYSVYTNKEAWRQKIRSLYE